MQSKAMGLNLLLLVAPSIAQSYPQQPGPEETQKVLKYLLAASSQKVPPGSHCGVDTKGRIPTTVMDVLSLHLSYFGDGQNTIEGSIRVEGEVQRCELRITRSNGEDVSNCTLRFRVKNELLVIESLQCFMTP